MNKTLESPNGTDRRTAKIVGALFVIGTAAGVLSIVFSGSILGDPDYLIKLAENQNQILISSLCVSIMGISLAMMSVMLFPILKNIMKPWPLGLLFLEARWRQFSILQSCSAGYYY